MDNPTGPYDKAILELQQLLTEAGKRGLPEHGAATLATADKAGHPSARVVYVISVEVDGLVIFANLRSGKGQQMQDNPHVAVCFFWPELHSQVVVEGEVDILSEADSDTYWKKRTRESQLGAWVSEQSEAPVSSRELQEKLTQAKAEFSFEQAPRPPHWRAFLVRPARIEFWKTGWHRLLARTKFQKQPGGEWTEERENP
jgi:pyridoxamine 5'-phosphate oxidase